MDNPQELKKAILATLAEKGDYQTILKHLSAEEKAKGEAEKGDKLTKLITPISAFADLLTENSKGAFMEDLEARLDDTTAKGIRELAEAIDAHKEALQAELREVLAATTKDLTEGNLTRYQEAETKLTAKLMQLAVETVVARAEEMLPALQQGARLTPQEIEDIVAAAALSVESQMSDIVGDYVAEQGITVDQITDFAERVKALIPNVDFSNARINWNQIVGAPNISQGGTNVNLVRSLIAEALAGFQGGGGGDVVGPASAVTARIATFNGTTGKLIQDGGATVAEVRDRATHTGSQAISTVTGLQTALNDKVTGPATATDNAIAVYDGTTGELIKNTTAFVLPNGSLEVHSGTAAGGISIGADVNAQTRSSNTRKVGVIRAPNFANNANVEIFSFNSPNALTNEVFFGGRNGGTQTAATVLRFVTAPDTTTTGGTIQLTIDATGLATFAGDVVVPDEAYDATTWNGNNEVPTKNAIRDKIESITTGSGITTAEARAIARRYAIALG